MGFLETVSDPFNLNLKIFSSIATVGFSNYFPFSNKHVEVFEIICTAWQVA